MGQLWQVTGDGIIVRQGKTRSSPELKECLRSGVIVEEQELVGERLHFINLSNAGPRSGWVNTKQRCKDVLIPISAEQVPAYQEADDVDGPLGGWTKLSDMYKSLKPTEPQAPMVAAAETAPGRRRAVREELPPIDDLEGATPELLSEALGFPEDAAKQFATLNAAQKKRIISEAKALINMNGEQRRAALDKIRRAWPSGPMPKFSADMGSGPELLPKNSCFPLSRYLRDGSGVEPGAAPEWGMEASAAKTAQKAFFARKQLETPAVQKEFVRSLKCDMLCTADPVQPADEARQVDYCRVDGYVDKEEIASTIMSKGAVRPEEVAKFFNSELKRKVLFLDGGMRARIQAEGLQEADYRGDRFKSFKDTDASGKPVSLNGNDDLLCLTKPNLIMEIHKEYLQAGSDICRTNTYKGTSIGQKAYKMQKVVYELNKAAAQIAKKATAEVTKSDTRKPRFVAGVIGPTTDRTWDVMVEAYDEQVRGLVDGGVDLLMVDAVCDTLSAKAAIYACEDHFARLKKKPLPLIVNVSLGEGGRTYSGASAEAFFISIKHAKPLAVGISSACTSDKVKAFYKSFAGLSSCWCNVCPGTESQDGDGFADGFREYSKDKLLNIVGGDSSATPSHITAMTKKLAGSNVRNLPVVQRNPSLQLSGLDACVVTEDDGFMVVGQRCTSMGSAKFKRLVNAGNLKDAVAVAVAECEKGADIVDINLDSDSAENKPLPGTKAISKFVRLCASEPKVAKVPFMLCSCDWEAIEEGLKCAPGKCIVNGICLMLGEEEFLRIAKECMRYGAAVVVLAIGEQGRAESYEDKVRICQRSYRLLRTKLDFPAEDIICDCQMPMIGLPDLPLNAMNFINAVAEVKRTCPSVSLIGGLSNLSLPFRGLSMLRDALHSVFLYYAIPKGLNLGMVEPGALPRYTDLDTETRTLCEEIILNRSTDGNHLKRFLAFVNFRSDSLLCMPVTGSAPRAPGPEAAGAREALLNISSKRRSTTPAEQKEYLRSLMCTVHCSASATSAEAGAAARDICRLEGFVQKDNLIGTIKAQGAPRPDDICKYFNAELRRRVCVVDGDIAAKIGLSNLAEADYCGDRAFKVPQKGNNALLAITKPDFVAGIHTASFEDGADICSTNTINGNAVSQRLYKTEAGAYELNKKAAQLAKRAAAEVCAANPDKPRFVAGVMGQTNCHLSTSSEATWDDMVQAYSEQVQGLVDGGVDIISIVFEDTLDAKAALYAVDEYFEQSGKDRLPLIITAVIDDKSCRTLSGQTIEAALISLSHARPMVMGISGSIGKKEIMGVYDKMIALNLSWCYLSATAGGETPDALANQVLDYANDRKLNFVGVQPDHVSAVVCALQDARAPSRQLTQPPKSPAMQLSSLEAHSVQPDDGLQIVSQRCSMAGSQTFKGLVGAYKWTRKDNRWEAAVEFCAKQCAQGVDMLDFNFDADTIDATWAMGKFMHLCAAEPKVAKVPFVLSSMRWPVIEEGLKRTQGKCIVNAISLLQGEEEFVRIAKACQRYGAAVIVMAVEKVGEFATYTDKVRICQRSYELLRSKLDFPAQDIIFDCNVEPISESASAKAFIDAIQELKRTCPAVSFIGGVSNLSLPYRSVNMIREALSSVLLYHAIPKGLNLAIVSPGALPRYSDLEAPTKSLCEEAVLNEAGENGDFLRLTDFVGYLEGPGSMEPSAELALPDQSLPLALPEPPKVNPMFRKPLTDLVQATGTVNASVFQSFGSKSHAAKNFHKLQMATIMKRNVMFSSISVWMGQGGAGPIPGSSSFMDGVALWERHNQMMNMSVTLLWGAVGEIGLRLAIYGSRDVFAQFDLGQKLIGPADTQFMEKQIITGEDVQEFISLAYLDQTWQGTLKGSGGGGLEGRKTFADM